MRGIHSNKSEIRQEVFTEVAKMAFDGGDFSRMEELPYKLVPGEISNYYDNIFLARAIVGERIRTTMGLPVRNFSQHAPLSAGIEKSAIDEKYYDPPLINIIKFACHACPEKRTMVTNGCQGGAGAISTVQTASKALDKQKEESALKNCSETGYAAYLEMIAEDRKGNQIE